MNVFEILVIAIALSMDAATVAICNTMAAHQSSWRRLMLMPLFFGFFQGLMPFIGYFAGAALQNVVGSIAPFLVAAILGALGLKMLYDARHPEDDACPLELDLRLLSLQAVATSIDALAVGVSFGTLGVPLTATVVIGLVTAAVVALAVLLGKSVGARLGNKALYIGGVLLLLVAFKSLIG